MQGISSNLPQILELNQYGLQQTITPIQNQPAELTQSTGNLNQTLLNDIASLTSGAFDVGSVFDNAMTDMAAFKDLISYTQNSLSQIQGYANDIKSMIAQAQQGGLPQTLLDSLQLDVNAKILDINMIKDAASIDGKNPFNGEVSVNIPSIKSFMEGKGSTSETEPEAYNIDLNFDVDGVQFFGTANLRLETAEDGSMQLAFDVSIDYDLSSLSDISSEEALNVIDGLLALMGDREGNLESANNIMDAVFEKIFEKMSAIQEGNENIDGYDSSDYLKNQIIQQSASTLNSIDMNQMPGLALSLI